MNIGDSIDNKVYIYFDFNAPILTNTATVSVVTFAQVDEFSIDANVYPIPFKDHFVVDGVEPGAQLVLSNPLGDIIGVKSHKTIRSMKLAICRQVFIS